MSWVPGDVVCPTCQGAGLPPIPGLARCLICGADPRAADQTDEQQLAALARRVADGAAVEGALLEAYEIGRRAK